jgi:hypothetical protein
MSTAECIRRLASAIGRLASGDPDAALEDVRWVADRLGGVKQTTLPGVALVDTDLSAERKRQETVKDLFHYWVQVTGHTSARLTPERARALASRLREGYTVADIEKAFDGAGKAAFVNDAGQRFDDITLVCRNGSKLEDFIQRGIQVSGPLQQAPSGAAPVSTVEEAINQARRRMAMLRKDGRQAEYDLEATRLSDLIKKRAVTGG